LGYALAETLTAEQPEYSVNVTELPGAVGSLAALQAGEADCAFSFANVAYEAFVGRLPDQQHAMDQLRGVALVQVAPLHLLASTKSGIRNVRDLRGRTLSFGFGQAAETGTSRASMFVLEAYGVGPEGVRYAATPGDNRGAFGELDRGEVDAIFFLTAQPSAIVARALDTARLVPIRGPEIDELRQRYPFFRSFLIRAGAYPGQTTPIETVGVENVLLCRAALDPIIVQRITRSWFITLQRLVRAGTIAEAVSPKGASATPIPLHVGAADFYRSRPDSLD
jgi:TRAP transporter TAXI family solute receptor